MGDVTTQADSSCSSTQTYGYDAARRLETVGGTSGNYTHTYRGAGTLWTNLALANSSRITNAYSSIGALTNTTLRTSGGTVRNRHSYVYNLAHQRTRQTRTDASYVDYTYDPIGQLRTAVGTGGQSTENLDGQERTSANTPTVSYARGQDLSGTLEGAGGIGGLLARSDQYSGGTWGRHVFYHADGNGNVTALIDSAQTVAATYRYNPYGQLLGSSGSPGRCQHSALLLEAVVPKRGPLLLRLPVLRSEPPALDQPGSDWGVGGGLICTRLSVIDRRVRLTR